MWLPPTFPQPGPQPRHVPWLGIEPANLWFAGPRSIHWATPARARRYILMQCSVLFTRENVLGEVLDLVFIWINHLFLLIASTFQPTVLSTELSSPFQAHLSFLGLQNPIGKFTLYPRILKLQNPLGSMSKFPWALPRDLLMHYVWGWVQYLNFK